MDLHRTLQDLYERKGRIEQAIASLECLTRLGTAGALGEHPKRRGRHWMSARERGEVSERMKRYWAGRRTGAEAVHEKSFAKAAGAF